MEEREREAGSWKGIDRVVPKEENGQVLSQRAR